MFSKIWRKKVEKSLAEKGIGLDENVLVQQLNLTNIPNEEFLTEVYLRKAKHEARELPTKFKCFVCGWDYDDQEEWISHFQEHLMDFMAGIPIKRDPEYVDQLLEKFPPHLREMIKKNIE